MNRVSPLVQQKRMFLFLGESGSGKTEAAVQCALELSEQGRQPIHFFDLDQTKPLYRARAAEALLNEGGITVHYSHGLLDVPTMPHGVREILEKEENFCVLDIGGNMAGAAMVGQFSPFFKGKNSIAFYLLNCYRPFAQSGEAIAETMKQVLRASNVSEVTVIANPNFGAQTTAADILHGGEMTRTMLRALDSSTDCLMADKKLITEEMHTQWGTIISLEPRFQHEVNHSKLEGGGFH